MANQKLVEYIQKSIDEGIPLRQVREILLSKNWKTRLVDEAIFEVTQSLKIHSESQPKDNLEETQSEIFSFSKERKSRKGIWILIFIVSLILVVSGIIAIVFIFINSTVCNDDQYKSGNVCIDYVCLYNSDCDDGNFATIDECVNSATPEALCTNTISNGFTNLPSDIEQCVGTLRNYYESLEPPVGYATGEILISFKEPVTEGVCQEILNSYNLSRDQCFEYNDEDRLTDPISVETGTELQWVCKLKGDERIAQVEPNIIFSGS